MTVAVRVSATVTGHRRRGARERDLVLALPAGEVTARQLIGAAVAAEVAGFESRAEEAGMARVLTRPSLAADLARGAVRTGGPRASAGFAETGFAETGAAAAGLAGAWPGPGRLDAAVDAALLAFGDGLFKVFVGDRELLDGDAALPVADGAALLFLRLVPLAGG